MRPLHRCHISEFRIIEEKNTTLGCGSFVNCFQAQVQTKFVIVLIRIISIDTHIVTAVQPLTVNEELIILKFFNYLLPLCLKESFCNH